MIFTEGTYNISSDMHKKAFTALDKLIKASHRIFLFHHEPMDMDAQSSAVAMKLGIKNKYNKEVKIAKKTDHFELNRTDLVLLLDVGDLFRLCGSFSGDPVIARVDHHPTSFKCEVNIEDITAGSTAELVTIFLNNFDYRIDTETAALLFKGIIADTGRLKYKIADSTLVALAILKSLNIDYKDIYNKMYIKDSDDLKARNYLLNNYKVSRNGVVYLYLDRERSLESEIDMKRVGQQLHELGNIKGCPIWVLITDIGRNKITMRMRSRYLPLNDIANKYGGGGHENAVAIRPKSQQEAKQILAELDKYVMEAKMNGIISESNNILYESHLSFSEKKRMKLLMKAVRYIPEETLNKIAPDAKDKIKATRYKLENLEKDKLNKILNSSTIIQLEEAIRRTKKTLVGNSAFIGSATSTTTGALSTAILYKASITAGFESLGYALMGVIGYLTTLGLIAASALGVTTTTVAAAIKNKRKFKNSLPDIVELLKAEGVLTENNDLLIKLIENLIDDISNEEIVKIIKENINSINLLQESRLPKDGRDPEFGIPQEEKYPLFDKKHVISAIKLFGHVEDKYESQLANAIIKKMNKYDISFDIVGEDNRLYKYLPKSKLNEDCLNEKLIKSKSEEAFKNNIKTEIESGKDPKQAVAIAYSIKEKINESIKTSKEYDGKTLDIEVDATVKDKETKIKKDDTEIEVKKDGDKLDIEVDVETDIHTENTKNINYYNSKLEKDIKAAKAAGVPENLAEIVADAVKELSEKQIGAFITFEKNNNLDKFRKNGEKLDCPISRDIFMTIFYPGTQLHDGAIIIKDGIIKYASVFYQNISSDDFDEHYGARHRAAMGVSKDTDAVVIVVSEETGRISFAVDGKLIITKPNNIIHNFNKYVLNKSLQECNYSFMNDDDFEFIFDEVLEESTKTKFRALMRMPEEKRKKKLEENPKLKEAYEKRAADNTGAGQAKGHMVNASIYNRITAFEDSNLQNPMKTGYTSKKNSKERKKYAYNKKHDEITNAVKYQDVSSAKFYVYDDSTNPGLKSVTMTDRAEKNRKKSQISLHDNKIKFDQDNRDVDFTEGVPYNTKSARGNDNTIKNITGKELNTLATKKTKKLRKKQDKGPLKP